MTTLALKQPLRIKLQHYMNALHIYSFMCRLKVGKEIALKTANYYERFIHPLLYLK